MKYILGLCLLLTGCSYDLTTSKLDSLNKESACLAGAIYMKHKYTSKDKWVTKEDYEDVVSECHAYAGAK